MHERFLNNCNGTVTDTIFKRMWMRFCFGQTWNSTTNTVDVKELSWNDAKELKIEYAGHSDWRIPTIEELESLVSTEYKYPAIDKVAFPNTPYRPAWSITAENEDPEFGMCLDFRNGQIVKIHRSNWNVVRLIRDIKKHPLSDTVNADKQSATEALFAPTQPRLDPRYIDNSDGTVTDINTGLMWMRCALGQIWDGKNCVGIAPIYTWNEAVAVRHSFAGYSDWRLPELAELNGIIDQTTTHPAIDSIAFPETNSRGFWTASANEDTDELRWYVEFGKGSAICLKPSCALYVRLVRIVQTKWLVSNDDTRHMHKECGVPSAISSVELPLDSVRGIVRSAIDCLRVHPDLFIDELCELHNLMSSDAVRALMLMHGVSLAEAVSIASSSIQEATLPHFLQGLAELDTISIAELRRHLLPLDLLPSAVVEEVNERAFDLVGEPALEEDGERVIVYRQVLVRVLETWDTSSS